MKAVVEGPLCDRGQVMMRHPKDVAPSIRALCKITDSTQLQSIERYLKQAIVRQQEDVISRAVSFYRCWSRWQQLEALTFLATLLGEKVDAYSSLQGQLLAVALFREPATAGAAGLQPAWASNVTYPGCRPPPLYEVRRSD